MHLYFTLESPHQWVILKPKGVHESGTCEDLSDLPFDISYNCVIAVVPGEHVVTRQITIPAKNRQKIITAIPFAVEESLVSPIDELHFVFLDVKDKGLVDFAYTSRNDMDGWLRQLQKAGINADMLLPDYLLLPRDSDMTATLVKIDDHRILLRWGKYQGAIVDDSGLADWLVDQEGKVSLLVDDKVLKKSLSGDNLGEIKAAQIGSSLTDWLRDGIQTDMPDLLQGDYQPVGKKSAFVAYRAAALFFILVGLVMLAADIAEYAWYKRAQQNLEEQSQALYSELFPDSRMIAGKTRVQMKNRINELKQQHGKSEFALLLTYAGKVLKRTGATIEELQYKDDTLLVICTLRNFSHLDRVKRALSDDPWINSRMIRSGARGDKVQARFEINGLRS